MEDIQKTKHYTTNAQKICGNLIKYIPDDANLIEPFVGKGDLLILYPNKQWECYDIDETSSGITRDTLLFPPDYHNKWVITNPPYLAKNKSKDKLVYNKYNVDDLYKASILSLLECRGGILIIPTNFLTDERTEPIRKKFFERFTIKEANIYTKPIFETTTYSICAFAFLEKTEEEEIIFPVNIDSNENQIMAQLDEKYGYRLAGEFYNDFVNIKPIFSRLTNKTSNNITSIKLYAIDTRTDRIRLEINNEPFVGKETDRTYATFTTDLEIPLEVQKLIVDIFNNELEKFRKKYKDLSMTNYRDYNRKRISFEFAYKLATKIYYDIINN